MLDEDLRKDVDGRQGVQRDGAVTGPHQVDPEHTGQVRRTHLVDEALLRHLRRTHVRFFNQDADTFNLWRFLRRFFCLLTYHVQETQQELCDDKVMLRKTFHDLFTPADPQAALHISQEITTFVRIKQSHG